MIFIHILQKKIKLLFRAVSVKSLVQNKRHVSFTIMILYT